jgi:signal transduction histidine kinase
VSRGRGIRVALIVAAVQLGGTLAATGHGHLRGGRNCWWAASCAPAHRLDVLAIALLLCGPLALAAWRLHPRAVLALVVAASAAYLARGYPQGPAFVSPAVAFMRTAIGGDMLAAGAAMVAGWALFLWLPVLTGHAHAPRPLAALALGAWLLVAFAAAVGMRARRHHLAQERRRREQEAQLRADEERLRIARELHDVLAHNISMINVQSGVALHLMDERPEQARSALEAINAASSDALREVRSVLQALRAGDGAGPDAPLAPAAGLEQLDDLVVRTRAAGLDVSLSVQGERRPLPASVDLAAYRIVQESLTNVVRHAGAQRVDVQVAYGADVLMVAVTDDGGGAGTGTAGSGSGIPGMTERATALGGRLNAFARPGGGFEVRAELPIR